MNGASEAQPAEPAAAAGEDDGQAAAAAHPDVITNIDDSPEAHAELDAMAQEQAREVSMVTDGTGTLVGPPQAWVQ